MFQKFDIRYKYDITFYQIKKKGRVDPAEMTRGRVDSGAEMETGRVDPLPTEDPLCRESHPLCRLMNPAAVYVIMPAHNPRERV